MAGLLGQAPQAWVTGVQDAYPAVSPDGQTLLFQSTRSGRWALYLSDPDGTDIRVLLDTGDDPVTASWSPDGRRIAYAATVDGQSEIFVMNADGSARVRLTHDVGDDSHPHWSADGRIFFNSAMATPDRAAPWAQQWHEVFSMTGEGGDLRQHTRCRTVCTFASPSPNGRSIVYRKLTSAPGRNWSQADIARNSEVFVSDMDGNHEVNVSNHPAFDGWPVWSPDSRWIAFASNRDGVPNSGQIWIARPDGTDVRQVSHGDWSNVQPAYTQDGTAILTYQHREEGDREYGFIGRWSVPAIE